MRQFIISFFQFIKQYKWECLIAVFVSAMVIGPIPFSVPIYYAFLACMFGYSFTQGVRHTNYILIWFLLAALASIEVNNPPAVFKSYERLGLLALLIGAVFPLFDSFKADRFKFRLLSALLKVFVAISVISFGCYLVGINYMQWGGRMMDINTAGTFGGLTTHSMLLAPICMGSAIYLTNLLLFGKANKWIIAIFLILSVLTIFLAASRSAFLAMLAGIAISLFLRYNNYKAKIIRILVSVGILAVISYPLYEKYTSNLVQKQQLNEQSGGTFSSRDSKWNNRMTEFERDPLFGIGFASVDWSLEPDAVNSAGVVEPGSSWLAVLSMTGILGAIPLFILIGGTIFRLYVFCKQYREINSCLLLSLIIAFFIHQFAEGYALAGGSYLCFVFWLILGTGYFYPKFYKTIISEGSSPVTL